MGVRAEVYHANLGPSVRDEVHKKFVTDQVEVIVATVALARDEAAMMEPAHSAETPGQLAVS